MDSAQNGVDAAQLYSRLAFLYDTWTAFTERRSLERALKRAAIADGEAVLEVAVGTGVLFREILRANPSGRNVGVDLTRAMIERARRKAEQSRSRFELILADARELAFDDAVFDIVMNNNMLGLVAEPDIPLILGEMRRVLRPGGRLVLVMMRRPIKRIPEWIFRFGAGYLGGWRDIAIEPFVRDAGFDIEGREIVEQLGIPSEVLWARRLDQ